LKNRIKQQIRNQKLLEIAEKKKKKKKKIRNKKLLEIAEMIIWVVGRLSFPA